MRRASPARRTDAIQGITVFTLRCHAPVSPCLGCHVPILRHLGRLGAHEYLGALNASINPPTTFRPNEEKRNLSPRYRTLVLADILATHPSHGARGLAHKAMSFQEIVTNLAIHMIVPIHPRSVAKLAYVPTIRIVIRPEASQDYHTRVVFVNHSKLEHRILGTALKHIFKMSTPSHPIPPWTLLPLVLSCDVKKSLLSGNPLPRTPARR